MTSEPETARFVDDRGGVRPLLSSRVTVGRVNSNDIVLPDPKVSRHHAELEYRNERWYLKDLDARNRTLVNKVPLGEKEVRALAVGDVLAFGNTRLRFELPADTEKPSVPSDFNATTPARLSSEQLEHVEDQLKSRRSTPAAAAVPATAAKEARPDRPKSPPPASAVAVPRDDAPPNALGFIEERSTTARRHYLRDPVSRIGTSPRECNIVVSDPTMDLKHAEIRFENGRVRIHDLGSKGGTQVDDGRFAKTAELADGCRIAMGKSKFSFSLLPAGRQLLAASQAGGRARRGKVLKLLAAVATLAGIAFGALFYYDSGLLVALAPESAPSVAPAIPAPAPEPTPGFDPAFHRGEIRSAIERYAYQNARKSAERAVAEAPGEADRGEFARILADLDAFEPLNQAFGTQRDAEAYRRAVAFSTESPLAPHVAEIKSKIEARARQRAARLKDGIAEAERKEDWKSATDYAAQLAELDVLSHASEGRLAAKRVRLRQRLAEAYANERAGVDANYRSVLTRVLKILDDVRAEAAAEPVVAESALDPHLRAIRDLRAHADFLVRFSDFDGTAESYASLLEIVENPESLSSAYESRAAMDSLLATAEEVQFIRLREYQPLCDKYFQVQKNPLLAGRAIADILDCLDRMAALLGDRSRQAANVWLARQREEWSKYYTDRLGELFSAAREAQSAIPEKRGAARVEACIAHLEKVRDILMLYPASVREIRDRSQREIAEAVGDPSRSAMFVESWKAYGNSMGDAIDKIYSGIQDRDPAMVSSARGFLDRLDRLRIPEDFETGDRIEGLKNRLGD